MYGKEKQFYFPHRLAMNSYNGFQKGRVGWTTEDVGLCSAQNGIFYHTLRNAILNTIEWFNSHFD
jgi:hypothetical protein